MITCKSCQSSDIVKNGLVRSVQRYRCKKCGLNFIEGDKRIKQSTQIKKALALLLYSIGSSSFRFLSKLFDTDVSLVYRWIRKTGEGLGEPEVPGDIREIEFDEMWHFLKSKKTKNGSSRPWIVAAGEPSPGLSVIVMLQHSKDFTTK